jgi:hypothetical protein
MTASAREYVVSSTGNDAAAGTPEAPFQTIGKAVSVLQPGDTCLVRAGVYRETVKPPLSGTAEKPITIKAWPGERPLVSGCDPVTGWRRLKGDVWSAPIGWDLKDRNQVFIDGKPGQEARWPNKTNNDPLDWEAVDYDTGSCNEFLLCQKLPSRPDGYWKGAVVWVLAGAKWTSWSKVVDDYVDAERKIIIGAPPKQGSVGTHMSPKERRGGFFYLVGKKEEIDRPGEWVVDAQEKMLYLQFAPGADPNVMNIEAQRRITAFDLGGRSHVVVEGFDVLGANLALTDSKHCLVKGIRAHWIGHLKGGNTGYGLNAELGVYIGGEHNTIRDSEIAYCAGNGIKLGGRRNAIVNCWIHHTDYTGSYDAPVKTWGEEMLISHNTIHDTGRDCLQPSGQAHVIQYNNIFHMGRLAHDLGGSYVCGSDGGGTEFHHNWVHDNLAHGTRMGIYMDNFTSHYLTYRNVVWNINGCDIRLNKPSYHCLVVNNTMLGNTGNWGRWKTDWMYGSAYVNNAVGGTIAPHPQAAFVDNTFKIPAKDLNKDNFAGYHAGAGKGLPVPGLSGDTPGIGAYEPDDIWKAGHDFANPPHPVYQLADTPLRTLVQHGSFEWTRWRGKLGPWQPTGDKTAKIVWGPGGISQSYTTRDTIIGAGVQLTGAADDGIEQTITGLRPNQVYELDAWVKSKDGAKLAVALHGVPGVEARAESQEGDEWQLLTARFTTGATVSDGLVSLTKTGSGTGFVDDIALVGVVEGMEPKLPGFAPVAPEPPKKPVLPRRTEALEVPRTDKPGGYPGKPTPVIETPGRTRADGPACQAWLAHARGALLVKVTANLTKPLSVETQPQWTKSDGVEICFAYPDNNAQHPTFVLHGFPNGTCEGSTEAGAPQSAVDAVMKSVKYRATVGKNTWTAEWIIPLAAADIEAVPGLELDFNIGIFRRESKQWIQWAGTTSQTWRVQQAGRIRLAK